jgi:hypothetical protein
MICLENFTVKLTIFAALVLIEWAIIKEVIIPEPMLEVYSARSREGQFGEPATPRDGLVVWGKGKQTRVYLYDFDKEEFDKTSYQSDLDI